MQPHDLVQLAIKPKTEMEVVAQDGDLWKCQWIDETAIPQFGLFAETSLLPLPRNLTTIQLINEAIKRDDFNGIILMPNTDLSHGQPPVKASHTNLDYDNAVKLLKFALDNAWKLFGTST